MQTQAAHLGQRQCRFWPSTARIGVGESIGRLGPSGSDLASTTRKRFYCGRIVTGGGITLLPPHAIVVCASLHALIVRPSAPFRRNPGDIAVRVLYVAGFAVDAVLGVDLEA